MTIVSEADSEDSVWSENLGLEPVPTAIINEAAN